MGYSNATEYYRAKCVHIRDEIERIVDDHYQPRIQTLKQARSVLSSNALHQQLHCFRSIRDELYSTRLSLIMIEQCILQEQWWTATHEIVPKFDVRNHMLECYHTTIKDSIFNRMFAITEHTFRHFVRLIDPKACGSGTEQFWKVQKYLLSKIGSRTADDDALLELARLTRNTIHNDGLFYPKDNKPRKVAYKGTHYEFKIGQPITFFEWEFVVIMAEDVSALLHKVVTDPSVVGALKTVN
jgi:hypothetical protein